MLKMLTSKRFTFVQKEEYEVDLEYNEHYLVLHLPFVKRLTKTTYLDMQEMVKHLWTFAKSTGYEGMWIAIRKEDESLVKLVKKLGFHPLGEDSGLSVYEYWSKEEDDI